MFILASLYGTLPRPSFTESERDSIAERVYEHVWQRSTDDHDPLAA